MTGLFIFLGWLLCYLLSMWMWAYLYPHIVNEDLSTAIVIGIICAPFMIFYFIGEFVARWGINTRINHNKTL